MSLSALGGPGPPDAAAAAKVSGVTKSKGSKGRKGSSASPSGKGKSKGGAGCASAVAGGEEAAGASFFTEAGDVVPLKVSIALSGRATAGGGDTRTLLERAHLDLEKQKLRMPTTRPAAIAR